MSEEIFQRVSERDHTVLCMVRDGHDDTHKITQETDLDSDSIRPAFYKLERLGLLTIEKPGGMTERVTDGQRRVFKTPLQAALTDKGREFFEWTDRDENKYEDVSQAELVQRVHTLESEVQTVKTELTGLKEFVRERLLEQSDETARK